MNNFSESMKRAAALLSQVRDIMCQGPLDFYLMKLAEHSEALCTRFAPIKAGERARIVKEVPCNNGWKGCEKTLAVGAVGVVNEVDYADGRFVLTFVPDEQWYESDGKYHPVTTGLYSFGLSETYLERVV